MINKKYSMVNILKSIIFIFVISASACSAQSNSDLSKKYKNITVTNCSFVDELFDYCKQGQLKRYQDAFEKQPSNFNKNYVLLKVSQNDPLISGVAVISKETGLVYTMSYSFRNEKYISYSLSSDVFCLDGEIYSQSRGDGRHGKNCFKFNTAGFELMKSAVNEGLEMHQESKKEPNVGVSNQLNGYITVPIPIKLTDLIQCKSGMELCTPSKKYKKYWVPVDERMKNSAKDTICAMGGDLALVLPTKEGFAFLTSFTEENEQSYWYLNSVNSEGQRGCFDFGLGSIFSIDKDLKFTVKAYNDSGELKTHHYQVQSNGSIFQID